MHVWQKNWFLLLTQDGLSGPLADRLTFRCAVSACRQDAALQFRQHILWNEVADKNNGMFCKRSIFWMQNVLTVDKKFHLNKVGPDCSAPKCHGGRPFDPKRFGFSRWILPASHVLMFLLSYYVFLTIKRQKADFSACKTWDPFLSIAIKINFDLSTPYKSWLGAFMWKQLIIVWYCQLSIQWHEVQNVLVKTTADIPV